MVWKESSVGEEFALHADIFNLGPGFLATDYDQTGLYRSLV